MCQCVFLCELMFLGTFTSLQEFFETWVEIAFPRKDLHLLPPVDDKNILGALYLRFSSFQFSSKGDINSCKKPREDQVVVTNSPVRFPTTASRSSQVGPLVRSSLCFTHLTEGKVL